MKSIDHFDQQYLAKQIIAVVSVSDRRETGCMVRTLWNLIGLLRVE